jgi:hypothetical protein
MLRIGFVLAVAVPAHANATREESCKITTDIVSQAVDARLAGQSAETVKTSLAKEGSGITGIYVATIDPLVDMVFGLDASGLNEKTVQDYRTQCLNF